MKLKGILVRCRLHYSLRALLIAATLSMLLIGVVSQGARQQLKVVRELRGMGGTVSYEDESKLCSREAHSMLCKWLGKDYFHDVLRINLNGCDVTDAQLSSIHSLRHLQGLELSGTRVDGTFLSNIKSPEMIVDIDLSYSSFDDAGMRNLIRFPELRTLKLQGTEITDQGAAHLAEMQQLRELNLRATRLTGDSLAFIAPLMKLQSLTLDGIPVQDKHVAHLRGLSCLEDLRLRDSRITDNGLESIAELDNMEHILDLSGTGVTKQGLWKLKPLTQLDTLLAYDTKIDQASAIYFMRTLRLKINVGRRPRSITDDVWRKMTISFQCGRHARSCNETIADRNTLTTLRNAFETHSEFHKSGLMGGSSTNDVSIMTEDGSWRMYFGSPNANGTDRVGLQELGEFKAHSSLTIDGQFRLLLVKALASQSRGCEPRFY